MVAGGDAMHATQDVKSDVKAIAPAPADLIARARALTSTLAARAAKAEQDRRVPAETIADMQAAGLFRVFQPKGWGGYDQCAWFKSNYDRTGNAYWLNRYKVCLWQH